MKKFREVTRRETLLECLDLMTKIRNGFSQKGYGIVPIERYIELYDEYDQKCEVIRELIRCVESESVKRALADWQKELMQAEKLEMKLNLDVPKVQEGWETVELVYDPSIAEEYREEQARKGEGD